MEIAFILVALALGVLLGAGLARRLDVPAPLLPLAGTDSGRLVPSAVGEICADLRAHPAIETVAEPFCQRCLDEETVWVALRQCLTCGHVGCCDSSSGRHATAHFHETGHPVVQSAEPDEDWRWCYVHHLTA